MIQIALIFMVSLNLISVLIVANLVVSKHQEIAKRQENLSLQFNEQQKEEKVTIEEKNQITELVEKVTKLENTASSGFFFENDFGILHWKTFDTKVENERRRIPGVHDVY